MNNSMKNSHEDRNTVLTVAELSGLLNCPFRGDEKTVIRGISGLENAVKGDLTFFSDKKLRPLLDITKASAVILPPDVLSDRIPALVSKTPYLTFIKAVSLFFAPFRPQPGIHPTSYVSPSAIIGKNVSIGALSHIGDGVEIGDDTVIFHLVAVYPEVKIGFGSIIHANVSLRENIRIGNNVIIHNGAVIGSDGFGYQQTGNGQNIKIPQTGTVIIEDNVEVGANSCIDRAALGETIIKRGTKIDNLVQVAHNVEIGPDSILVSQTGIAGSTRLGERVVTGGQVGISDHLTIGNHVIAAAQTGISKNLPDGAFVSGSPASNIQDWKKACASIPHLYELLRDVRKLKKRVEELEKKE